ncbi:MAG: RDD family protein [Rickettsiales bacterium]|nr:RDD family protein [Rickettsiales bacterium]
MEDSEDLKQDVEYVGFSPRLYASIIDTALSTILLIPVIGFVKLTFGESLPSITLKKYLFGLQDSATNQEELRNNIEAMFYDGLVTNYLLEMLAFYVFLGAIIVMFWWAKDATPGKKILGIRVVDAKTLESPGLIQCIIRVFAYIVSILPLMLGFFWANYDKKRRCFHDLIAGTVVIKVIKRTTTNIDSLSDELE